MTTRNLMLALALVGAATAPLSAMAGAEFVYNKGEPGVLLQDVPSNGLTRAEKLAQDRAQSAAEAAQRSGWRFVGGEVGWTYEGHQFARVGQEWVCVDGIDHGTKADFGAIADPRLYRGA